MFPTRSERSSRIALLCAVLAAAFLTSPAAAQDALPTRLAVKQSIALKKVALAEMLQERAALRRAVQARMAEQEAQSGLRKIVSSEISVSRNEARLDLEFAGGEHSEFSIRDGKAYVDGDQVGDADRGGALDRSWRDLLDSAMEVPSFRLGRMLVDWRAPGGSALDERLENILRARPGEPQAAADAEQGVHAEVSGEISDSVDRLVDRISQLQQKVQELESNPDIPVRVRIDESRGGWFRGPFRNFFEGLSGVFKTALIYGILFALAFATIFFGGRRFIEGVADTARTATTRSLLVGLAASFLVIPAFILGIIALAISIIGIPALLVWVPFFPVAVGLAIVLGYISVAHAAGEALAERRFYATDWFQRGNSYYFLISGLGLLLAPFIVMNVVHMAGPWLGFLYGILVAVGVIVTWAALSIGFGAVLLSRAGTRPIRSASTPAAEPEIYAEPTSS